MTTTLTNRRLTTSVYWSKCHTATHLRDLAQTDLTASITAVPTVLGHPRKLLLHPSEDGPAVLSRESNWMLEEEDSEDARAALENYRSAVTQKFGEIPTLDVLTSGLGALNDEFMTWVAESVQAG